MNLDRPDLDRIVNGEPRETAWVNVGIILGAIAVLLAIALPQWWR